eukprot:TRINITY_DN20310_c0_g1_i1.p1 TRINITY_DN20310_c0_g1~~TRINITY_DN20310_c0_g1_i1.p1  ORF type:complete len:563 (-),score=62.91 TRINITY_DN20310_c0_g1_i1:404-2092(-)
MLCARCPGNRLRRNLLACSSSLPCKRRLQILTMAFRWTCVLGSSLVYAQDNTRVHLACEDGAIDGLPAVFFDQLTEFQHKYNRDSLDRSREMLYGLYERKLLPDLEGNFLRCPAATLEIMMNSVLASYVDYSPADGEALYHLAMQLAERVPATSPVAQLLEDWKYDTVHTYPLLFNKRSQSCHEFDVKVYVYDVPQDLVGLPLKCVQGQWGTEVLFHKFLGNAACRTDDPDDADFFFVPVYSTCIFVSEDLGNDDNATRRIWDPLLEFLTEQPSFKRHKMSDHIFVFADGQSTRAWDSVDLFSREAIFMLVESKCPTWDEPMRRYTDIKPCSSSWKDIIIPGHTDHHRAQTMLRHNRPSHERDLLMTFHGRHPESSEVYESCRVRADVVALGHLDRVSVGGFVEDYLERKGRSHFCLIPGGTSPWTNHLYESFFSGCIPVIISDEYEVAFQHLLDWPQFSIKWPESAVDELYATLESFSPAELAAMKAKVDEHACWFNYFTEDPACSPYVAVLRTLAEKKRHRKMRQPRFWNVVAGVTKDKPQRTTRFHVSPLESPTFWPSL